MKRWTLIYDGDCAFCSRCVDLLRRWDRAGRLDFVPFQRLATRRDLPVIAREALERAAQLVSPEGDVVEGAEAARPLLELLPGGASVAVLLRAPGMNRLAHRVYEWIARNRHVLPGGTPRCAVPAPQPHGAENHGPGRDHRSSRAEPHQRF